MACVNHPDVMGVARCESCGAELCANCVVSIGGKTLCGPCKDKEVRTFERGVGLAGEESRGLSPWERRASTGMFPAVVETIKGAVFRPTSFFSSINAVGGHTAALGYGVLVGTIFSIIGQGIGLIINLALGAMMNAPSEQVTMQITFAVVFMALAPLLMVIYLYIGSGLAHLGLMIIGGNAKGFDATFRTYCFCVSANIFVVIPFIGGIIAGLWAIVIQIIGLREMQGISTGKAAFAVLWILLVGIVCGLIGMVIVVATAAAGSGGF